MAAELIELLKTTDFDGTANAATASHVTWVAQNVSISQWRQARCILRNETPLNTAWPTGSSIVFTIVGVVPTLKDSTQKVRGPTLGSVSISAADSAFWPSIHAFEIGSSFGGPISASVTMVTKGIAGTFLGRLSATLAGKP